MHATRAAHGQQPQETAPHGRTHPGSHARAVQPLRRAERLTTLISAELNISPGNLYYHYPAKDELINSLFDRYERALRELLQASDQVRNVEDAWLLFHMLFELIWQYRFLYRDLNDLLSKNRRLETHFQFVLRDKNQAIQNVMAGLTRGGAMKIETRDMAPVATSMAVVLTYWLSYEYVRDPRRALEPRAPARRCCVAPSTCSAC